MSVVAIDLDQRCFVIPRNPVRRAGPMRLRTAIRRVTAHPTPRKAFDIALADEAAVGEPESDAMCVPEFLTMWTAPFAERPAATSKP